MKKNIRSKLLLIFGVGAVIGTLLKLLTDLRKNDLIIRLHYSGWRTLSAATTVVAIIFGALLLAVAVIGLCLNWRNKAAQRSEQELARQRQAEANEAKKLRDPEDVRKFFIRICNERPHCQIAKMIKSQLDKMNEFQSRFENLLEVNDISMSANIRRLLQDIEDSICADCKSAINRYIVSDESGFEATAEKVYKKNMEILEKVQSFLDDLADFASGQSCGDDALQNLTDYETTIRASMNEEVF